MSTAAFSTITQTDDAALIAASRNGDRNAFGQIVRKYQGMIAGLIYASVGDTHRSEDLAQETFISAWKSLSGLREPAKLPAWLCQIARHRVLDHVRSNARQNANLTKVFDNQPQTTAPPVDAAIISAEENELLWRTLSQIPQPYRETLVLYYRQSQSTTDVAAAMETTEAAVRQRLSRGREMLRENIAKLLEKNLSRTAPSEAFTAGVIAALPAAVPASIKMTMLGGIAKGSATTAGSGFFAVFSILLAPLIALGCGIVGVKTNLRTAQNPRERRFVIRYLISIIVATIVAMALMFSILPIAVHFNLKGKYLVLYTLAWAANLGLIIPYAYFGGKKRERIRVEEGLPAVPTQPPISPRYMFWAITGATVATLGWMLNLAQESHDWLSFNLLIPAMILLIAWTYWKLRGRDALARQKFALYYVAALGIVTLIMLNWRLHYWLAAVQERSIDEVKQRLPYWQINFLIVVIWSGILGSIFSTWRKRAATSAAPMSKRSSPEA
jgi:RNA polymerase sigma factor (sigma-70 family)